MEYKGYIAKVQFSEPDQVLHGKILGIRDVITFECESVREIKAAFEEAVDEYLEWCNEKGENPDKPCSGNIALRITPELHRDVQIEAELEGRSINSFIGCCLDSAIHTARQARRVSECSIVALPSNDFDDEAGVLIMTGEGEAASTAKWGIRPSQPWVNFDE